MAGQALREQIVDLHARCLTDIKQRPHKRENPVRRTTWRYTELPDPREDSRGLVRHVIRELNQHHEELIRLTSVTQNTHG